MEARTTAFSALSQSACESSSTGTIGWMLRTLAQRTKNTAHGSIVVARDLWSSVISSSGPEGSRELYAAWIRQGRPVPPPPAAKHLVILEYAAQHGLYVLVETGTYVGDMVAAMYSSFEEVHSIELSTPLYLLARARFAGHRTVHLSYGDSSILLGRILRDIDRPCLFWLDGHFSGGVTAGGPGGWPLMAELRSILSHPVKDHVVLIDDARYLLGEETGHRAPSLDAIRAEILRSGVLHTVDVQDDIVRVVPLGTA